MHADENDLSFLKRPSVIFFLLIPALVLIFRSLLGFNGLYGQDSYEYLRYSNALIDYLEYGNHPGNFNWPVLYPFVGAALGLVFDRHTDFALQLITICSFATALYFTFRTLVLLYGNEKRALQYVLCFGVLSSYFLRLGVCDMSDMPGIFFISAAVFYMIRFTKEKRGRDILSALFFTAAAKFTRIPAPVVLLVPFAVFAWSMIKNMNWTYFIWGIFFCLVLYLPERWLVGVSYSSFPQEWSPINFFHTDHQNPGSGFLYYHVPNILFVMSTLIHPGYLLIAAVLVFFMKKEDLQKDKLFFFVIPILLYLFFLAGFANQNIRLNTFIFPLLLILYFPAFLRLSDKFTLGRSRMTVFLSAAAVIQLGLFYFAFNDFFDENHLERDIAVYIKEQYPGLTVYTMGMSPALHSNGVDGAVELDSSEARCGNKALVLIDTKHFEEQWYNLRPMGNWEYIQQHCSVRKVKTFDRGWDLYEIE